MKKEHEELVKVLGEQIANQIGVVEEGLRDQFKMLAENMDMRFEKVDRKFEEVERRFNGMDLRFDNIDRELQNIKATKADKSFVIEKIKEAITS